MIETKFEILARAILELDTRIGFILPPSTRKELHELEVELKKYNE